MANIEVDTFVSGGFTAGGQVHVVDAGGGNSRVEVNDLWDPTVVSMIFLVQDGAAAASSWTALDFVL